ncbi:MAG: ribosome maturation factor RimP [Synergistaceae bacterium]|nr:ribosome maturation factor RimP [Synergistaceae bacterium]
MRPNKSKLKRKPGKNPVSHSVKLSVEAAIRKIIEELGYECVQVLFVRESEKLILRILFDSMGGINIRDCEIVSRKVSRMLDEEFDEKIPERYTLETSSPGIERPLLSVADYARFSGQSARLRMGPKKSITGRIIGMDEGGESVVIECDGTEQKIPFADIARANLVWDPEKSETNKKGDF